MAGRTLGEAWVTIRPETAAFRAELMTKVKGAMKGFNPAVKVSVDISPNTAKLRTELKTAVTAASKGLTTSTTIKTNLDNASLAKTKATIDAATKNRVTKVTTDSDAEKAAAAYVSWWDKALNQRIIRERAAAAKAQATEDAVAEKTSRDYVNWWNKALSQQELKSREVSSSMQKDLDNLSGKIDKYRDRLTGMIVSTNDSQAESQLDLLDTKANMLAERLGSIKTNVGVAGALVQMAALDAAAEKFHAAMSAKNSMPDLGLELTLANSQFTHLEQNAMSLKKEIESALSPGSITIGKVTEEAKKDLIGLAGGADAVLREINRIKASGGVATPDDIAKVKTLTGGMSQLTAAVAADGVTIKSASGSYRGWVNALLAIARAQIPLFNGALEKMLPHMLAVATGTHIMVEAALELIAVWVPAAVALTIFGVAATKAALEVASDVRNMGIAANGTGQQFEGMSKRIGKSMSDIAKPYVFEAYGLALIGLQKQSQTTAGVIQTVGGTIDKWISEAVLAYQKGTGKMAKQGASDFAILGDSFKQVGTLINGFMKITPGYAKDLLMLGDGFLHVASAILNSSLAQKIGSVFLALHGLVFYVGLFATLGTRLGASLIVPIARLTGLTRVLKILGVEGDTTKGKLGNLMSSIAQGWQQGTGKLVTTADQTGKDIEKGLAVAFTSGGPVTAANKMSSELKSAMTTGVESSVTSAGSKFSDFKTVASDAMSGLGSKVGTAAKGIKGALTGMLSSLGINPWLLGIAAVAAAVVGLAMLFRNSTNAAKEFGSAAQTALSNSSIATFGSTMQLQMKAAEGGLDGAKSALRNYTNAVSDAKPGTVIYAEKLNEMGRGAQGISAGFAIAKTGVQNWQNAVNGLNEQNKQFNSNLNLIAKTSGIDVPSAMNLATQAGLTTKQMMTDSGVAAQEDALQVEGLAKGYASLTQGIGGVNTAYQAMNVQNSQTMKDAQSVAGAFANYTTLITGGANAFDTFVQGQATLSTNLKATGKSGGTATLSLGKLKDVIKLTGTNLDGLSPAAVTANQSFLQQVNNSQALYGSLIQLAAASGNTKVAQNNLSAAGKDMISTLLKTAGGSKAAQQQIYSLAQTFGYTGSDTLPALVKWLGTTGDRTTDLQKRMNGLTAGAGNLEAASKALSGEMNSQLSGALSKSIIDAEGGQAAFDKFASSIKKFAANASTANMNAVLKQGENLKQVFISSAGSAAAAEPVLQNYFMTLGIKNQATAKRMADQILGIGGAAAAITKPVETNKQKFVDWARQMMVNTDSAGKLWDTLAKNNFNPLSGDVEANKKKFLDWAAQMGINKKKAGDLWSQLLNNKLEVVNAKVDGNKKKFIDLMVQMGDTQNAAQHLWDTLKKAPNVKASVAVAATTSGQVQAVAQASGAQKQVIGKLFFSAQGQGRAMGGPIPMAGKIPGWHNSGDNLLAIGPGGPIGLQGGEAIVPKNLSTHPEFTSFAKKKGIPGFSGGGLVGTDNLNNIADSSVKWKTDTANSSIAFAGDAMKANVDGAYDAIASAYKGVGGSVKGSQILADAERYKGHKYVFGGPSNPAQGWDCSSFAGYVLGHDLHMPLPGGVGWSGNVHGPVAANFNHTPGFSMVSHNPQDIQAGDLLVEGSGGHVGFGVGPNQMFSAYGTAFGTIFSDAKNMTNIYRDGAGGKAGATVAAIKTGVALIDKMASAAASDYTQSSAMNSLFPKLGGAYTGNPPMGGATGTNMANGKELYSYLLSNLFGGNKIAAAGATASVWGESGWNPFAQGTGGRGLIGWTPPSAISDSAFAGGMDTQLPAILKFVTQNGDLSVISDMFRATSVAQAAQEWDQGVERAGINDVHATGIAEASSFMSKGGMVPGFAKGGKVPSSVTELNKLKKEHDQYAADYHRHMAAATKDKSPSAKRYQRAEAAKYAKLISQIDSEVAFDKAVKLKLPKPTNDDMRLAEKLSAPPWSGKLTAGAYSTSPLGWGLQPILGDLMIADRFKPQTWVGKANTDPQASGVMANWVAAMGSVGGFLGANPGVAQLAGKATGLHGKTTGGKSFKLGGTLGEDAVGFGISSGAPYTFHQGDRMVGPNQTPGQINQGGMSQEDRSLWINIWQELKKSNQIAAQQPREYAKALNSNASRKTGRP